MTVEDSDIEVGVHVPGVHLGLQQRLYLVLSSASVQ